MFIAESLHAENLESITDTLPRDILIERMEDYVQKIRNEILQGDMDWDDAYYNYIEDHGIEGAKPYNNKEILKTLDRLAASYPHIRITNIGKYTNLLFEHYNYEIKQN